MSAQRPRARAARIVAVGGTVLALLCTPPLARPFFCIDVLLPVDVAAMWLFAAGLLAFSWMIDRIGARRGWIVGVFLSVLSLVAAELAARAYLQFNGPASRGLARFAWMTYQDQSGYQGHPFLQYTGRPEVTLIGSEALRGRGAFNRNGFHGPAFDVLKPEQTVRIACLGGSTTASGYPQVMQYWLADQVAGSGLQFECMNLGHGFYNSTHAAVNFVLNVLDHEPDYVVFHHGWNESRCGENGAAFRGDYSHRFKAFEYPPIPDSLLIRASTIYRYLKMRLLDDAEWRYLDSALFLPRDRSLGIDLDAVERTFERNVNTIVDLALARGITPVLVTQPHTTDPDAAYAGTVAHMVRFSACLRRVAKIRASEVIFVDLDATLSGAANHLFKDVGHMTDEGIALKAMGIGQAILAHRNRR